MMNNTLIILSTISVDLYSGLVRQWKRKYFFDTCNCSTTKIQKSTAKSFSNFRNYIEHSKHFT